MNFMLSFHAQLFQNNMYNMVTNVEFVKGSRDIDLLNSYTYHKSKSLSNGVKFMCSKRENVKCKVCLVVQDDGNVVKSEDYSH